MFSCVYFLIYYSSFVMDLISSYFSILSEFFLVCFKVSMSYIPYFKFLRYLNCRLNQFVFFL